MATRKENRGRLSWFCCYVWLSYASNSAALQQREALKIQGSQVSRTTCHQFSSDPFCTPVWNQPLGDVSLGPRVLDERISRQGTELSPWAVSCTLHYRSLISGFFGFLFPLQASDSFALYMFNFAVTVLPPTFPLMWTHPGVGNMRHSWLSSSKLSLLAVVWLRAIEGHGELTPSHLL